MNNLNNKIIENIIKENDDNFIFSPISYLLVMASVYLGSEGNTKREFEEFFEIKNREIFINKLKDIIDNFSTNKEIIISSSIWINSSIYGFTEIKDRFKLENEVFLKTSTFTKNLSLRETKNEIEKWIYEKTKGLISYKPSYSNETLLVLMNAIYFKDTWYYSDVEESRFKFYTSLFKYTYVDGFYFKIKNHPVYKKKNYIISFLDYTNGSRIFFIRPKNYEQFIVRNLIKNVLKDIKDVEKFNKEDIKFTVPNFKINTSTDLVELSKKLKLKNPFSLSANFSNISDFRPLFISNGLQKAYIKVDKTGTEVAAFSKMEFSFSMDTDEYVDLTLNKPFIYIIKNNIGDILFVGSVKTP